jgi:hypothetical protein
VVRMPADAADVAHREGVLPGRKKRPLDGEPQPSGARDDRARPTLENHRARSSGGRTLQVLAHSELVSKPVRGSSVTRAWAREGALPTDLRIRDGQRAMTPREAACLGTSPAPNRAWTDGGGRPPGISRQR